MVVVTRGRKLDHERIIELRKKGLTIIQVAKRMGCSPVTTARVIRLAEKSEQDHKQPKEV